MNLRRPLILASSSPRRQLLMKEAGFQFVVDPPDLDESFPSNLSALEVPAWLARKKAAVFAGRLEGKIVLTADTVVILEGAILNKPIDRNDAVQMLRRLSGRTHRVVTAVCILSEEKTASFEEHTNVTFKNLNDDAIGYYVDHAQPFDKAGAYGAQECLEPGVNPCSAAEIDFLRMIGRPDLAQMTRSAIKPMLTAIDHIDGSYFNVMGLPVHIVYDHLTSY